MKVLVTGATGPFGRAVSRRLADAGHDVLAMARRTPSSLPDGVSFVAGDIQDLRSVSDAMAGCDAVVHLAWVVAPLKSDEATRAINIGGTRNVLEAMATTGARRLVFSSSVLAYGAVPGHPPFLTEDDERRPEAAHLYAAHKKEAEDLILEAARDSVPGEGLSAVCVRAGIIAGRDVDNTIFRFFTSPALPVPDPERTQQFVHTDDVARFTAEAVESMRTGPVNITGDGVVTMREIADIMDLPMFTVPECALRRGVALAWRAGVSELAPGEIGGLLHMPIVDTTSLRDEWGFTCAWTSRDAVEDMARAARGVVTLGKKTVTKPGAVPLGSTSDPKPVWAFRRRYARDLARVEGDMARLERVLAGDLHPERRTAMRGLVDDLREHAEHLTATATRHGVRS